MRAALVDPGLEVVGATRLEHGDLAVPDIRANGIRRQAEEADDTGDDDLGAPPYARLSGFRAPRLLTGQDVVTGVDEHHRSRDREVHRQELALPDNFRFVGDRAA